MANAVNPQATPLGASQEAAGVLTQPLRSGAGTSQEVPNIIPADTTKVRCDEHTIAPLAGDIIISIMFWYGLFFAYIPSWIWNVVYAIMFVGMVVWRYVRTLRPENQTAAEIPYTCGYVARNGREMILVATLHIAPRAPRDVHKVVETQHPDCAMIELDEERLDRMREPEVDPEAPKGPRPEDLQPVRITCVGKPPMDVLAQRALWNAEWTGEVFEGKLAYDEHNPQGMNTVGSTGMRRSIALVKRGGAPGEWAPFTLKAHRIAKCGAKAVLVTSHEDRLPVNRIGGLSIQDDLAVFKKTKNCGFPPVPMLLLAKSDGDKLQQLCLGTEPGSVSAKFTVISDTYPRRTLRKRICQSCGLLLSGIGILYGVIRCFSVEVGGEFLAAEVAAKKIGKPCVCIDVDLNKFWKRIVDVLLPWPRNILNSLWCWICFPRVAFQFLFPPRGNIDTLGATILMLASLPLRNWIAFVLAGFCASTITSTLLRIVGFAATKAGEETGVVDKENEENFQVMLILIAELYFLPQIYTSVAASRDESMYQAIVKKSREYGFKRFVVVVGGGHANGILQRVRKYGF